MKAIILAAGYGTRLYPLTLNKPKALLEVGGKTILERVVKDIFSLKECEAAYIVSNDRFYKQFCDWTESGIAKGIIGSKKLEVLNDGTTSNDDRLGAIGDINFAIEKKKIEDDILVMGSDNLFGFHIRDFEGFALSKRPSACLALHDVKDIKKASLYGIAIVKSETKEVVDFQEKPKEPKSTLAATAVYFYPTEKIEMLKEYMKSGLTKDAPGNFVKWLSTKEKVYGFVFQEKWYDIGDIASLESADEEYRKKEGSA